VKKDFKEGLFFHVFNKSIANYEIFNNHENSQRFIEVLDYYNNPKIENKYSIVKKKGLYKYHNLLLNNKSISKIISYCIMPDHYHLLVKIVMENTFSKFISDVENSYTRYFNIKYNRKGPLWQTRFKAIRIKSNEQLLHVSRYIHLNPTTSNLINNPEDWIFSSYKDFITNPHILKIIATEISISNSFYYKKFVENNKKYQRSLKKIKKLLFD
jgi:putative transposase